MRTNYALIVDDEPAFQQMLKTYFKREHFTVDCASSIKEAEQLLGNNKYDLVVVDIFLGKDTGIDLLRNIRAFDKNVHVVLITGQPDVASAAEALRLGAFDYLTKPLSFSQIIGVVQRVLRSKELIAENLRKQANLDAIFHSASDGIVLVDHENRLAQVNEAAMRSCGYAPGHMGTSIMSIKSGCDGVCRKLLTEVLQDGTPRSVRRLECCSEHGRRLVSFNVSPVLDKNNGGINGAVAIMRDETDLAFLEKQLHLLNGYGGIVGRHSAMQRMYALIEALANVSTTVLINGESGTGKELVASALHHQGARSDKPFVKVNCAALAESILESELFGHVKGAFTGAMTSKIGRFQKAHSGTIFLDEIGDISPAMQMRLLRVLQEQEFEPVGDSTPIKVDVRVIAATNQDLAEKVRRGTFRNDLYYRLNVVRLIIPPLRERRDDIPLLVEHFLNKLSHKFNRAITGVSTEAMGLFMRHSWPGNVRELEHTLEHAAILCPSTVISIEHLPQDFITSLHDRPVLLPDDAAGELPMTLEEALAKAGGSKAKAARILGVSRCTVYRWLNETPPVEPS